jgi:hypothetical protein|tara:strand:- start:14847 stop:15293 length:447 start_codon:yes stop_codon:yes gene_type:complete
MFGFRHLPPTEVLEWIQLTKNNRISPFPDHASSPPVEALFPEGNDGISDFGVLHRTKRKINQPTVNFQIPGVLFQELPEKMKSTTHIPLHREGITLAEERRGVPKSLKGEKRKRIGHPLANPMGCPNRQKNCHHNGSDHHGENGEEAF